MTPGPDTTARWIDTREGFAEVVAELEGVGRVAIDTEFHRERTYYPKLALLQLAWEPDELALIDPLAVDAADLAKVLDSDTTIVLHAASQDLEVLRLATGTVPRRLFDTQVAAGFVGFSNPSLALLHSALLDIELDKGSRMTDWLVRPLSAKVLDYAADDVRHLLEIHDRLVADLKARDRLEWAVAEFHGELDHASGMRDPDEAWRRVKDVRRLHGRAAGVARAVATWREKRAADLDVPVRFVLGDMALVNIAQHPPKDVAALGKIRGVDARSLKGPGADALLEAVAEGLRRGAPKPDADRRPTTKGSLRPAVTLLSSWLSQFAKELAIDTQLIATRNDIEDFVNGGNRGRLASGWRHELVGRPMQRLLDGEAALAYERGRGIVLEARQP